MFALLWFGSWVFLNGLVLVHRSILSDYCTDDKSRRILQRLVSAFLNLSGFLTPSFSNTRLPLFTGLKLAANL